MIVAVAVDVFLIDARETGVCRGALRISGCQMDDSALSLLLVALVLLLVFAKFDLSMDVREQLLVSTCARAA